MDHLENASKNSSGSSGSSNENTPHLSHGGQRQIEQMLVFADHDAKEAYCLNGHFGIKREVCDTCQHTYYYKKSQSVVITVTKEMVGGTGWHNSTLEYVEQPVKQE